MMSFALNEIEAMGKKAARGAGLAWGIAEEAGKAARWLSAHQLPGPELLSDLLAQNEGRHHADLAPASVEGTWTASSGLLCPLIAGAALSDYAAVLWSGRPFELGGTSFPLLLAPYAQYCALEVGAAIELTWNGVVAAVSPEALLTISGDEAAILVKSTPYVRCRAIAIDLVAGTAAAPVRRAVAAAAWDRLKEFTDRTYAPATQESRDLGAGADRIDSE
jgi:hypothetical protein